MKESEKHSTKHHEEDIPLENPHFKSLLRGYASLLVKVDELEQNTDRPPKEESEEKVDLLVDVIMAEARAQNLKTPPELYVPSQQFWQQEPIKETPFIPPEQEVRQESNTHKNITEAAAVNAPPLQSAPAVAPEPYAAPEPHAEPVESVEPAKPAEPAVAAEPEKETKSKDTPDDAKPAEVPASSPAKKKEKHKRQENKQKARKQEVRKENKEGKKKNKALAMLGEVVFYCALVAIILVALLIRTSGDGTPKSLAGYSGMIVLTGSMQDEIPQGSLVIAKQVDPETLQIGDDITFMANKTTSVTHRIIGIQEKYKDTGERAFETKGTMNPEPDKNPVMAANVVGKVIFHSHVLGVLAGFVANNWPILIFLLVILGVLMYALRQIGQKDQIIIISDNGTNQFD